MWRLYAAGGALAVLVAMGLWVGHLRHQAAYVPELRQQLHDQAAQHAATLDAIQRDQAARDAAERGYLDELSNLRRAAAGVPAVRVCQPATAEHLPATAPTAADAGRAAAAAGLVPAGAAANSPGGRDIGPSIERLVDTADALSARCRAALLYVQGSPDG